MSLGHLRSKLALLLAYSLAQRCVADFSGRKDSDSLFTADQRT